jgi:tRNA-intron endonuclease
LSADEEKPVNVELKAKGQLEKKGVKVPEERFMDALTSRGYGMPGRKNFLLSFHEALYLVDKGMLGVEDDKGKEVDFQQLLRCYEAVNENAWANYLIFRDLRSRGYVVREGFGQGVDFRVYERGEYGKGTAKYLIVSAQEGKPVAVERLSLWLKQSLSLKKELVLAVMNRRGEIVYYSVSELNLE